MTTKVTELAEYEIIVRNFRSYETDNRNSPRDAINALFGQLTGRMFSAFWQSRGIGIDTISKLQFCRFEIGGEILVIGRDVFLRDYGIDSAIVWAGVMNADYSKKSFEYTSKDGSSQTITVWLTATGKRTYRGKPDNGELHIRSGAPKRYKRNRRNNF